MSTNYLTNAVQANARWISTLDVDDARRAAALAFHTAMDEGGLTASEVARGITNGDAEAARKILSHVGYLAATGEVLEDLPLLESYASQSTLVDGTGPLAVYQVIKAAGMAAYRAAIATGDDKADEDKAAQAAWKILHNAIKAKDEAKAAKAAKADEADEAPADKPAKADRPVIAAAKAAQAAIEAAHEAMREAAKITAKDLAALDEAGAAMVALLQTADTFRANLEAAKDKTVGKAAGRGDIVAAGK